MMGTFVGWLVAKGVQERFARPLAYLLLFLTIMGLLAGVWAAVKRDVIADHEAKIEQRARPATDQAAQERSDDAISNAKDEQELHDAIASQPDTAIAPSSRALACERLRRAGRNPPACR